MNRNRYLEMIPSPPLAARMVVRHGLRGTGRGYTCVAFFGRCRQCVPASHRVRSAARWVGCRVNNNMGTGPNAPVTPPRNFGSESTKRTTPKKKKKLPMPPSIPPTLTTRERKMCIQEYRKEHAQLVANIAELSAIDGGALSKSDKLHASQLAVDLGITTHELRRSWIIFERLASTMPDRVTVREMVLYFHVRRTIFCRLVIPLFTTIMFTTIYMCLYVALYMTYASISLSRLR